MKTTLNKIRDYSPCTYGWAKLLPYQENGMTLRDYFAAKAMQGLISKGMEDHNYRNARGVPVIVKFAYEYADAMLAERKKNEPA